MAKQKTSQRYVFKIHSRRLRESKWDLTLSLREARENHELISLADSQALRFIDALNGDCDNEERIRNIRREIASLRREDSSTKIRNQIRKLYDELDALQFKPDYINVVIDKKSDYLRAVRGFRVNNIPYVRLIGTTGGIKCSTIVFVSKRLSDEMQRRIDNGRDMSKEFVPAKLEAYRALVCSGSIPVSDPACILVVPDCVTHFRDAVTMLDDSSGGEPTMEVLTDFESELNCSDGFGLMTYELARRWSEELGLACTTSGFCIRNSFCKGMVFPFPFREFCRKVALPAGKNNMVQDIWGDWQDINRVELILSASMLKLWDSYDSCEDYLHCCKENGYTFSVTKTCTLELERERRLNYQFIQSYRLNYEQIEALVRPTCDEIGDVLGGDWRKALLFLCGEMRDEDEYVKQLPDNVVKALMIEPALIQDSYIQKTILGHISKRIDDAKIGRIKVHGNYQILSGDPYALCQSIFGLEVTGLLKAGEIYSRYWIDEGAPGVVLFRAPMSCHANIRKMRICAQEDAKYWYQYMKTVTILNCWDNTCAALNGADFDGDLVFSTNNEILLKNHRPELPIMCVQHKAAKKVVEENDYIQSNINSFGDDIGKITNRITTMYDVQSQYEVGSKEFEVLDYRIKCGQLYQQNSIDRAKGILTTNMPKSWYDRGACRVTESDDAMSQRQKEFDIRIVAAEKPYFMSYIYPAQMKQYREYLHNTRLKSQQEFELQIDEIMAKPAEKITEAERVFINYYFYKMPVGINGCVMNELCWMVEETIDQQKKRLKAASDFDMAVLKTGNAYSKLHYTKIVALYDTYTKQKKRLMQSPVLGRRQSKHDRAVACDIYEQFRTSVLREAVLICSSEDELCDILLDLCSKSQSARAFMWDLMADVLVRRLLRLKGGIHLIIPDEDGEISYGGKRYKTVFREVNECARSS